MAIKKEKLTEAQIEATFEIVKGFNTADGTRYNVGKESPNFVTEKNFKPKEWKILVQLGALRQVEKPDPETEKEKIVFEEIEE